MSLQPPQSVVFATNNPTKKRVVRALRSIGCAVRECEPGREECQRHIAHPSDIWVIDIDAALDDVTWLIDALQTNRPTRGVLVLSENVATSVIFDLLVNKGVNNVIAKRPGAKQAVRVIDEQELIETCSKLLREDIFGIEQYLPCHDLDIRERSVRSTDERVDAVTELAHYLGQIYCHERLNSLICMAADELLMNGIFSAPTDADGRSKYSAADRTQPLVLEPDEHVRFRYACDGHNVLVSVLDRFGSLSRATLVEHLQHGWLGQQKRVQWDSGGAGLGLHMVFNSATQLVVNIEAGKRTEMIVMFYIREGMRKLSDLGHSLNLFFRE